MMAAEGNYALHSSIGGIAAASHRSLVSHIESGDFNGHDDIIKRLQKRHDLSPT